MSRENIIDICSVFHTSIIPIIVLRVASVLKTLCALNDIQYGLYIIISPIMQFASVDCFLDCYISDTVV